MKFIMKLTGILALVIMVSVAVPVHADTGKPSILASDVTVSPSVLMPGDIGTISVVITNPSASLSGSTTTQTDTYNYGPGSSNGITTPSYTSSTTTSGSNAPDGSIMLKEVTLLADAPIYIISPYQFLDVGRMGMGNSYKFTFIVKVDNNAANATYFMKLKVRTGEDGIYLNYPIPIKVDDTPLSISICDAPDSITSSTQTITLDVVNNRMNDVSGVAVVPSGDGLDFIPRQQYVIGDMSTGNMYTAQFDVTSENDPGTGDPSFKVVYKNGDNWHESRPVTINTSHDTAASTSQYSAGGSTLLYVLCLVVVIIVLSGGVFMYLKGKRNKK